MTLNFVYLGPFSLMFLSTLCGPSRRTAWRGLTSVAVSCCSERGGRRAAPRGIPHDVPTTPVSWHGATHLVVALLAFSWGVFGAYLLSGQFTPSCTLPPGVTVATALPILSVLLCIVKAELPFVSPRAVSAAGGRGATVSGFGTSLDPRRLLLLRRDIPVSATAIDSGARSHA
jgi:hypothetical protein